MTVSADYSDGPSPHIRRLMHASPMLADLARADVLLLRPVDDSDFEVLHHVRPINARTVYPIDQAGVRMPRADRPLAAKALETGEIFDGGVYLRHRDRWIRTLVGPVTHEGRVVAVLAREFYPAVEFMPGDLELVCFSTYRRLASMIASGSYPFGVETRVHDHPPRVGDGVMIFDRAGRLHYASPNALSVLRQVGVSGANIGQRFGDLGIDAPGISQAYANRLAYTDEIELGQAVLSTYCVPLLTREVVTGALVLVRNITELRQRDRLLMTKDATIAEIHHRVKNSLQTVSSLLQLQSRRLESVDARDALAEAARRIRSVSVVHELLSHRTDDEMRFDEILATLADMTGTSLMNPSRPVAIHVDADPIVLSNAVTTPLALVVSELLQNALQHAHASRIDVRLRADNDGIHLAVVDDGVGFESQAADESGSGLGLTIARTLVEGDLYGSISFSSPGPGAVIEVDVPRVNPSPC